MIYKTLLSFTVIALLSCTPGPEIPSVDFLVGSWKVDEKEQFEVWEKNADNYFEGYAYVIDRTTPLEPQEVITETLVIKIEEGELIYEATVHSQNGGEGIKFTHNPEVKDRLSFENLNHDFPQKIQYEKPKNGKMHVWVLGPNDEGFDYDMILQ